MADFDSCVDEATVGVLAEATNVANTPEVTNTASSSGGANDDCCTTATGTCPEGMTNMDIDSYIQGQKVETCCKIEGNGFNEAGNVPNQCAADTTVTTETPPSDAAGYHVSAFAIGAALAGVTLQAII